MKDEAAGLHRTEYEWLGSEGEEVLSNRVESPTYEPKDQPEDPAKQKAADASETIIAALSILDKVIIPEAKAYYRTTLTPS
jgi:hypothetical protein